MIDAPLPGRSTPCVVTKRHFVNGHPIQPPFPANSRQVQFGLGCFWGAEKGFWQLDGVHTTAVGYAGGVTPNPTYEEVCSGRTGHAEVVLVVFVPTVVTLDRLFEVFWESHDPTQGDRQGNDVGTQYRSLIILDDPEERSRAEASRSRYGAALESAGFGPITTTVESGHQFYYAEDYHQQYLAKNPQGYCGLGGTGVSCPAGIGPSADV